MYALRAQAPLDVTTGLDGMVDRYLTGIADRELHQRASQVAGIHTPAEVAARQAYIREKMLQEIGGFPEKSPLEPRITGTLDRGDYKVEKLVFQSRPHFYVTADVFVPADGHAPYPAVLGTAGHSADGKAYESYQRVWVSLAKRGFLVLAYDPPGQGERLEHLDASGKSLFNAGGTAEHMADGMQCLLTGSNVAAYFIWDGIRAFDYLLTRPDVDPKRIAVAGNSGGGTQSSYLAAFEPRLAAAAPSCYLTSWEKLWAGPGPQDSEQVFADFLKDGLDFPDFLIAFAPKPIQMATAIRDFFPIEGARATYAEAQRIFHIMGAEDHVGFFEFDDPHGWSKPPPRGHLSLADTVDARPQRRRDRTRLQTGFAAGPALDRNRAGGDYVHRRADGAIAQCGPCRAVIRAAHRRARKGHPGSGARSPAVARPPGSCPCDESRHNRA